MQSGEVRRTERPDGPCIATLSYLYNHHQRQLAMRLTDMQHEHHEITVSTIHAHLDHDLRVAAQDEIAPVADRHVHPAEPRTVRVTLKVGF